MTEIIGVASSFSSVIHEKLMISSRDNARGGRGINPAPSGESWHPTGEMGQVCGQSLPNTNFCELMIYPPYLGTFPPFGEILAKHLINRHENQYIIMRTYYIIMECS